MFTHSEIWAALDKIAEKNRLSISGLSKRAGLDPTSFNKSKRVTGNGRLRWPSTESVSKVLACTGTTVEEFASMIMGRDPEEAVSSRLPMISFQQAAANICFDDAGFPTGDVWKEITFPYHVDRYAYALEVSDDTLLPVYRRGDILVISPDVHVRPGDRTVSRSHDGNLSVAVLRSLTANSIEFTTVAPSLESWHVSSRDIDWMARIVWASQ
ncbi:MAG: helix-turn-helix transcriptional regulator [Hyphomicrobiales bacterium]|nr:helix-turn-helix transcriptional regulator [Hyphomicrobiales bacterium]